jgi:hypothetical protein
MDSYQFYIDSRKQKISIDCSTYQSSLFSLAALLDRSADTLLQDIFETGKDLTNHNPGQGVFEELLAERVIGKRFFSVNIENVHWFHFTRTLDSPNYEEGLLPLEKNISKVWDFLFQVFNSIDQEILNNLRTMKKIGVCNSQFAWKIQSEYDQGPFGMLVRDTGFFWQDIGNVDYFSGAEIIQDICIAYENSYGQYITPLFLENTSPCIVSFIDSCDIEDLELVVQSIISYLYFRPENTMNRCWCYNGDGKVIPKSRILKIEIDPVPSEIPAKYQQIFSQCL